MWSRDLEKFCKLVGRVADDPEIGKPEIVHERQWGFQLQFVRIADEKFELQVVHKDKPNIIIASMEISDLQSFMDTLILKHKTE